MPSPLVNVIVFNDTLAVDIFDVAKDEVVENDDVSAYDAEVTFPTTLVADTYEAVVANDEVSAYDAEVTFPTTLVAVTYDAVVAKEALTAIDAVPNNEPVTLPEIILIEPESIVSDPVIIALPLNGKIVVALLEWLDVIAYDAEVAIDDVNAYDAVDGVNVIDVAADAVVANDAVVALEAVPNNDAVTLPEITLIEPECMVNDPVITALPLNGKIVVATFA